MVIRKDATEVECAPVRRATDFWGAGGRPAGAQVFREEAVGPT